MKKFYVIRIVCYLVIAVMLLLGLYMLITGNVVLLPQNGMAPGHLQTRGAGFLLMVISAGATFALRITEQAQKEDS